MTGYRRKRGSVRHSRRAGRLRQAAWFLSLTIIVQLFGLAAVAQITEVPFEVESWIQQSIPEETADLNAISVVDRETAFAVGAKGAILMTNDGGSTWTRQETPSAARKTTLRDISAVRDAQGAVHGWAVGDDGTILTTSNGGTSWNVQMIDVAWPEPLSSTRSHIYDLNSVSFVPGGGCSRPACYGHAVGVQQIDPSLGIPVNRQVAIMLATEDGGTTWKRQPIGDTEVLRSVHFVNKDVGWAIGNKVLRTTDGGTTWQEQATPLPALNLTAMSFTDDENGWVVGDARVLKTTDGGETWEEVAVPHLSSAAAVSATEDDSCPDSLPACVVYIGDAGAISATTNGKDWVQQYICRSLSQSCGVRSQNRIKDSKVTGISRTGGTTDCLPGRPSCFGLAVGASGLAVKNTYLTPSGSPPFITSVSPGSGCRKPENGDAGTWVRIQGTGLSSADVRFGGSLTAPPISVTDTDMLVNLGSAVIARPGQNIGLQIENEAGNARRDFIYQQPCVTVNVPRAIAGDTVKIVASADEYGRHPDVFFLGDLGPEDDVLARSTQSGLSFTVTVPPRARSGPIEIRGDSGKLATSEDFIVERVDMAAPTITSVTPASQTPGRSIKITGNDLRAPLVSFNGGPPQQPRHPVVFPYRDLEVEVPSGATSGPITVEAMGSGERSTTAPFGDFQVLPLPPPEVTGVSPAAGGVGTLVRLSGENLKEASVSFNGTPGIPVSSTLSTVSVRVPPGATTGPLTVETPSRISAPATYTAAAPSDFVVYQPPGSPAPLIVETLDPTHAALTWQAPAKDGSSGPQAKRFQIRFSTTPIDTSNFDDPNLTKLCDSGDCALGFSSEDVGAQVNHIVSDLEPAHTYYFAVRAVRVVEDEELVGPVALSNPVTMPAGIGTTAATGALDQARSHHSATILPSGKVLVAGGLVPDGPGSAQPLLPTASAEIYDPLTRRWTATGSLNYPRHNHTATLLGDDSLLVIGGDSSPNTVELYRDGHWTILPPSPHALIGHTATLLPSPTGMGKVLVTGGSPPSRSGGPVSLFDPAVRTSAAWTTLRPLLASRQGHSAVLIAGSSETCGTACGKILISGGDAEPETSSTTGPSPADLPPTSELYDPTVPGGASVYAGENTTRRRNHAAVVMPDGKVVLAGGTNMETGAPTPSAERFDPLQNDPRKAWTSIEALDVGRAGPAFSLLPSGMFLVASGSGGDLYGPSGWRSISALQSRRPAGSTATLLSGAPGSFVADSGVCGDDCGKVLIVGGVNTQQSGAELFTEPPTISSIAPQRGSEDTEVQITGSGFASKVASDPGRVLFGGTPAKSVTLDSYEQITAVAPAMGASSKVLLSVITDGGVATSSDPFIYEGSPGRVMDLSSTALSGREVELSFSAPGMVQYSHPPAKEYIIKQSRSPIIDETSFAAARSLDAGTCSGGVCMFDAKSVGDRLSLSVSGLTPETTYHYALRARNDDGESGPISNSASITTHTVTPGAVADLTATARSATIIDLSFSAPGSNGDDGPPAASYLIRQSLTPITDREKFESAQPLCDEICEFSPEAVGDRIDLTVKELEPGRTYYYALRARDDSGSVGPISNTAFATTQEGVPGTVSDLAAEPVSGSEIRLRFSAPGSDGEEGPPAGVYVIKQSRQPIHDEADFDAARALCDGECRFSPKKIGDKITLSISGLKPGTTYFYALRAKNAAGSLSSLSNRVEARTFAGTPGKVRDLKAKAVSHSNVRLTFSAPGSNRNESPPAGRYVIKQSRKPITGDTRFEAAFSLCGGICSFSPRAVGDRISLVVTELRPDTVYHYALRALDEAGAAGPISSRAKVRTDPDRTPPARVVDLRARPISRTSIALSFSAPGSDEKSGAPTRHYLIKQSRVPITSAKRFRRAFSLCDGICRFSPDEIGQKLSLKVTGLRPGTTYHYVVVPIDEAGNRGRRSNAESAVTMSEK